MPCFAAGHVACDISGFLLEEVLEGLLRLFGGQLLDVGDHPLQSLFLHADQQGGVFGVGLCVGLGWRYLPGHQQRFGPDGVAVGDAGAAGDRLDELLVLELLAGFHQLREVSLGLEGPVVDRVAGVEPVHVDNRLDVLERLFELLFVLGDDGQAAVGTGDQDFLIAEAVNDGLEVLANRVSELTGSFASDEFGFLSDEFSEMDQELQRTYRWIRCDL